MSFVTTRPEALLFAASTLEGLGSSMAAQDAAAAAPTTSIAPAAADEVSALQAAQFSAYGAWYQQVSAQAKAIHQSLVNNLNGNAGSYGTTEAANQVTTSAAALPRAAAPAAAAAADPPPGDASLGTTIEWGQNVGAAASDFIALGQGQFYPGPGGVAGVPAFTGDVGAAGASVPATPVGVGAAPVLASVGQGPSIGALSVPPSWAASGVPAVNPNAATLTGAGFTSAAPHNATMTTIPGGLPSMATTGRGGYGLGAPRYGVKPVVMPTPTV